MTRALLLTTTNAKRDFKQHEQESQEYVINSGLYHYVTPLGQDGTILGYDGVQCITLLLTNITKSYSDYSKNLVTVTRILVHKITFIAYKEKL